MTPDRETARDTLLARCGFEGADIAPLAADASFRSYDRVIAADGRRLVLMNAPPGLEDIRPFHRIAVLLESWGLSAPRVLGADTEAGFLALEDLGADLFSRLIGAGHDAGELYSAAVDVLTDVLHQIPPADIPPYDMELLLNETDLLIDWRLPEVTGQPASETQRAAWRAAWEEVLTDVAGVRSTLVLRDYHVDNLIWLPGRRGTARVGLLDFQDAVRGHPAYDLASLLSDVRRDVPAELEQAMLRRYLDATGIDEAPFRTAYTVLAAQRNAKIIGIFTRLWRRDGKDRYLDWLPRTWALLRRDLADPALAPVARWLDNHMPHDPAGESR